MGIQAGIQASFFCDAKVIHAGLWWPQKKREQIFQGSGEAQQCVV
jgi:hypothetical protein